MYYVCKMCGRAMWSRVDEPIYCYFDRSKFLENISVDDAKRMGIDFVKDSYVIAAPEFPADVQFDPYEGTVLEGVTIGGPSLFDWQRNIMEKVRAN